MTVENFKNIVENHDDIMMHCDSFKFTIMTCFEKLMICEQQTDKAAYFETIEDMLEGYKIKGGKLKDKLPTIVLDSCS